MTSPLPSLVVPPLLAPLLLAPLLLAAAGVVAGVAARRLLRWLRRGARVPPPWCEAGVASAWAAAGAGFAAGAVPGRWLPVLLGLGWLAVAAGAVDVLHRRLPDALTLPALPVALLLLLPLGPGTVLRGVVGAAVAVAVHAAAGLLAPGALGGGDVKLAAPLGAVLAAVSWPALALAGLLAALLSGGLAVALLGGRAWSAVRPGRAAVVRRARAAAVRRGQAAVPRPGRVAVVRPGRPTASLLPDGRARLRSTPLPHGPSMLIAAWVVAVVGVAAQARGP